MKSVYSTAQTNWAKFKKSPQYLTRPLIFMILIWFLLQSFVSISFPVLISFLFIGVFHNSTSWSSCWILIKGLYYFLFLLCWSSNAHLLTSFYCHVSVLLYRLPSCSCPRVIRSLFSRSQLGWKITQSHFHTHIFYFSLGDTFISPTGCMLGIRDRTLSRSRRGILSDWQNINFIF